MALPLPRPLGLAPGFIPPLAVPLVVDALAPLAPAVGGAAAVATAAAAPVVAAALGAFAVGFAIGTGLNKLAQIWGLPKPGIWQAPIGPEPVNVLAGFGYYHYTRTVQHIYPAVRRCSDGVLLQAAYQTSETSRLYKGQGYGIHYTSQTATSTSVCAPGVNTLHQENIGPVGLLNADGSIVSTGYIVGGASVGADFNGPNYLDGEAQWIVTFDKVELNNRDVTPYQLTGNPTLLPATAFEPLAPLPRRKLPLIQPYIAPTVPEAEPVTQPAQPNTQPAQPETQPLKQPVLPIKETLIKIAPPVIAGALIVSRSGQLAAPAPALVPVTDPGTTFLGPALVPLTTSGPAPNLEAMAKEMGKQEDKLERIFAAQNARPSTDVLNDILQLAIKPLYDYIKTFFDDQPGGEYTFQAPCQINPVTGLPNSFVSSWPDQPDQFSALVARLDALAALLQIHKDVKQPVCDSVQTVVPFNNVTVHAYEVMPTPPP